MTPEVLAELHARAMVHGTPWSVKSFSSALQTPSSILVTESASSWQKHSGGDLGGQSPPTTATPEAAQILGFALGSVILDQAELLTLVVEPNFQGRGIGRLLLQRFEARATAKGANSALLEVSENNQSACALYARAGWQEISQRPGYYRQGSERSYAALIMRKDLV